MSITTSLTTDLGKLRLELADDNAAAGLGVLPDGGNYTDAQLQVFLDREGSVMGALAAACENLHMRYLLDANQNEGQRRDDGRGTALRYASQARQLRRQYGGPARVYAGGVIRQDAYSEDAPTDVA